jgi:nitrogen fixation protein FixH
MKRGWGWPVGVATILAATVGVNIWVAVIAGDDPSFSVEPDYYRKAVQWDSTMAQARENERLGWRVEPRISPIGRSVSTLSVTLTDGTGLPIRNAKIDVTAFFNARADSVVRVELHDTGSSYDARLPIHHAGEWELRFDVHRGGQRFTNTTRVDVVALRNKA